MATSNAAAVDDARQDPRSSFLELFPQRARSHVTNLFLDAVRRGGLRKPSAIVQAVSDEAERQLSYADDPQSIAKFQLLVAQLSTPEALDFAAWAVNWCSLSSDERRRAKEGRSAAHLVAWMAQQPPTTPQLNYLVKVGWRGDVDTLTRLDASALIEKLKAKGGRRG